MSLEKYLAKKSGKGFKSANQPQKGKSKDAADADKLGGAAGKKAEKGGSGDSLEDEFKKSSKKRPYMDQDC